MVCGFWSAIMSRISTARLRLTSRRVNLEGDVTVLAETSGTVLAAGTASVQDREIPDEEAADETPETQDPAETDPGADETPANTEDPDSVNVAADLLGDQADAVADAAGNGDDGSGGTGGSGGEENRTFSFSGDFAGTFGKTTTSLLLDEADIATEFGNAATFDALTDVQYGQASAVNAVAVDGVAISGSFGLSFVDHSTTAVMRDTAVYFYESDLDELQGEDPALTRLSSKDQSVFDMLVTGRSSHADDGWGVAVSASFNRMRVDAETRVEDSSITNGGFYGTPGTGGKGDEEGEFEFEFELGEEFEGEFSEEEGGED